MHSRSSHDRQLWLKLQILSYDHRMNINSPETAAFEAAAAESAVIALVVATDGPAYRKAGAAMAFLPSGARVGSLSSGCIEGDLALHAAAAAQDGRVRHLRYGAGSEWVDLRLPCGGGMDVLVLPHPDRAVLATAVDMTRGRVRRPAELTVELENGLLEMRPLNWNEASAGLGAVRSADVFTMTLLPEPRFQVYGTGIEVAAFARIIQACGYDHRLHGAHGPASAGPDSVGVAGPTFCADDSDPRTAVVLFFHDHDLEPPILVDALASPAFWVGAQGSRAAAAARRAALAAAGVPASQIARLHGPIGLIPSARDSRTLAISVLAEILDAARGGGG